MQVTNSSNGGSRWRSPQAGLVKINFDGAILSESNKTGIGVVILDNNGAVLASCSKKSIKHTSLRRLRRWLL